MSDESKTLFELAPEKFVVPGKSTNGERPLPDLVFELDPSVPGLYRARVGAEFVSPRNGRDPRIKEVK